MESIAESGLSGAGNVISERELHLTFRKEKSQCEDAGGCWANSYITLSGCAYLTTIGFASLANTLPISTTGTLLLCNEPLSLAASAAATEISNPPAVCGS